MCIHYRRQIDLSAINLFFQNRRYSTEDFSHHLRSSHCSGILFWMGRIDDNGIVGFIVFYKVSVVVAGPSPCSIECLAVRIRSPIDKRNALGDIHIGID